MGINSSKNSFFIIVGIAVLFIFILLFQVFNTGDEEYQLEISREREKVNEFFRTSIESPLDSVNKVAFEGLHHFDVDKKFRVTATFVPNPKFEKYAMPRTNGEPEVYIVAGTIQFKMDGLTCKLTAYQPNEKDRQSLFIPFRDLSSGKSTYGGGRYIDARIVKDRNRVTIDFNRAYNPYCVFDYKMICPIPPAQNDLPVKIAAGEKMYEIIMPAFEPEFFD